MDIYKVLEDPRIKMLENDIVLWNNHCRYTDEEWHVMKQLLRSRSNVLYELNVYDSYMHQMLVSFNNRLRKALFLSMMMAAHGRYAVVKHIIQNMEDVNHLKNGLAWKMRMITGMKNWTGNGRETYT